MKKGQIIEGIVTEVHFPNKGIVETEEGRIEVKGVLPGQRVSVAIQKIRHGKAEGRCVSVLERAPYEIGAQCPHAGDCGGCSYQTVPYEEQLKLKEQQVLTLMKPILEKQQMLTLMQPVLERQERVEGSGSHREHSVWEGIRKSPRQSGYRNKMEFTFGDEYKDGPLSLGMHKKGSFYDIVPVTGCQIVDEDYRKILRTVMEFAREKKIPFYHRLRHEGYLRHLLVRKAARTGEILIAVVTTTQTERPEELRALCERLLALSLDGKIVGIVHTSNDSLADIVQNDATQVLYGQDYFYEELLGLRFRISEFSFFQTNSLGAEVLYETAREFIGEISAKGGQKPVIFDLYSGTGTIAQMMAPVAEKVIGVEIVEEAVNAARENASLNGLHNCEFIAGDVLKVLDEIKEQPDFIILDPPRDGIHPKALKKIIAYGVERLVYISCKPTSLARDLEAFLDAGYGVERMCCVDMFPGTVHVETVVLMSRKDT
ncbi:MAG: 23S rRNA (uracil(1939)-C(5))-methyltransferase RlmD [Clostridium sp.]|nr:23S rRNA (uracil(1939)-C(5))-methyltransferase RlmD [Clostridium sp.]